MDDRLVNVSNALSAVEEYLDVLTKSPVDELAATLAPIDKAKVQVGLAYSINALLYVLLKVQGISSKDSRHTQVKQELDRVKGYIQKIKYSEEMAVGRKLRVDAEAVGRFIHHALSSDQAYIEAVEAAQVAKDAEAQSSSTDDTNAKKTSKKHKSDPPTKAAKSKRARK
ncbi:DNA-binding protein c1d [Aphanomyces cochlioides]|nr:DNA-binding protein c1d [Aphanomyces cochlioides]